MDVVRLLHRLSAEGLLGVHSRRRATVWAAVEALLSGQRLWLTALGRSLPGGSKEKHAIKRVDRLLGNARLHSERRQWYRWICRQVLCTTRRPVVVVDWSDLDEQGALKVLRAAVAVGGRALPVYEEVHEKVGSRRVHRAFVYALREVLGDACEPVLVTDAGFRPWWFELVEEMGWHYVGRVRNRELVCRYEEHEWCANKELHHHARPQPRSLGWWLLSMKRSLLTRLYVYRRPHKGRVRRTRHGAKARSGVSGKHAAREREPWLLASNLPDGRRAPERVMELYGTRMQIEESFRDLKAPRTGFAMRENLGRDRERVAVLLLLAALAMLATWLMGLYGYARKLHWGLQANTIRTRRVLSVFTVGRRLLARREPLNTGALRLAFASLHSDVLAPWDA